MGERRGEAERGKEQREGGRDGVREGRGEEVCVLMRVRCAEVAVFAL